MVRSGGRRLLGSGVWGLWGLWGSGFRSGFANIHGFMVIYKGLYGVTEPLTLNPKPLNP